MGINLLSLHIKNRTIRRVTINVGDAKRREGGGDPCKKRNIEKLQKKKKREKVGEGLRKHLIVSDPLLRDLYRCIDVTRQLNAIKMFSSCKRSLLS